MGETHIDGNAVYESSHSTRKGDGIKVSEQIARPEERSEISGGSSDRVLVGELLGDLTKSDAKESTRYIYKKVIEKSVRPFFGAMRAQRLATEMMKR